MYITIDEADRRPIYRQVADEIKSLIARGELEEGVALPPVRQVANDLGVNLNTIAAAYRDLQKEGLLRVQIEIADCARRIRGGCCLAAGAASGKRSGRELEHDCRRLS